MLIKPADAQIRNAIETIFQVQSSHSGFNRIDTQIRGRELLHQWTLSRVERLVFRSEELPPVILKAATVPLLNESLLYSKIFSQDIGWTPTLYGQFDPANLDLMRGLELKAPKSDLEQGQQLWLFFEDIGPRNLYKEPTLENLQRATVLLAAFHAAYHDTANDGSLLARVHLPFFDSPAYLRMARETLKLTTALSQRGAYSLVDAAKLEKLAKVVDSYWRVIDGLANAPQTLVHGDFNAENILFKTQVKNDGAQERLYLIDWANAFIGAGLLDLVDLVNFGLGHFGPEIMLKMLSDYRQAWQVIRGEQLGPEPLEEIFICCQLHKKISLINWFNRCTIKWIPTGRAAYNPLVASLIEEVYNLSTILI